MKRPRFRGRWPWLGLLLVPALAWAGVLALVPTDWARARLVARLAEATGRAVRIDAVRLGYSGNLQIEGLSLAERSTPDDPWLKAALARVDVHLGQVLLGRCEPGEILVEGASVRIWRRKDGTAEIGDFLRSTHPAAAGHSGVARPPTSAIALRVRGSSVRVVNEPSGTKFDLTGIEAMAGVSGRLVTVNRLHASVGGGQFELAAKLDRDPISPRFEVEVRASGVTIDSGLPALAFLVPVVAGTTEGAGGKLNLGLALKGQGATRAEIRRTLRGTGSILLDPIDLDGSKFLEALDVLGECPQAARIGSLAADLTIDRGRIASDDLAVQVSRFPFVLTGWTDFDGRFDYAPNVERITARLPREARGWIAELKVNFDQLAGLRISGRPGRVAVTSRGQPIDGDATRSVNERARFRETARRIRDRFFR